MNAMYCGGHGNILPCEQCSANLKHRIEGSAARAGDAEPNIAQAAERLKKAVADDADYAWSWHCNLAMPIMDATGITHAQANEAAAWLMRHLFGLDTSKHEHYQTAPQSPELKDAYDGAREDLAIWKRRALEAERDLRLEKEITSRLARELNALNGPTHMGEPAPQAPERAQEAKEAERYRWLEPRLLAADFDWNESGKSVLIFEWPDNVAVGGSCDQNIDAALAASREGGAT